MVLARVLSSSTSKFRQALGGARKSHVIFVCYNYQDLTSTRSIWSLQMSSVVAMKTGAHWTIRDRTDTVVWTGHTNIFPS